MSLGTNIIEIHPKTTFTAESRIGSLCDFVITGDMETNGSYDSKIA